MSAPPPLPGQTASPKGKPPTSVADKSGKTVLMLFAGCLTLGVVVSVVIGILIALWLKPDPPIDDSDLLIDALAVAPADDAWPDLEKAADALWLPDGYDNVSKVGDTYEVALQKAHEADDDAVFQTTPVRIDPAKHEAYQILADQALKDLLENNQPTFAHLEAALAKPTLTLPRTERLSDQPPAHGELLDLGQLLLKQASWLREDGQPEAALARLEDVLAFGSLLDAGRPLNGIYTLSVNLRTFALAQLEELLPHDLPPERWRELLAAWPDYATSDAEFETMLKTQYTLTLQAFERDLHQAVAKDPEAKAFVSQTGGKVPLAYDPNETRGLIAEKARQLLADIGKPAREARLGIDGLTGPEVDRHPFKEIVRGNIAGRMFAVQVSNTLRLSAVTRCQLNARLAVMRTLIAARLYRDDHEGRLPATLDDLVPDYLPEIPIDPGDGEPIRWNAEQGIAASVGLSYARSGDNSPLTELAINYQLRDQPR